MVAILAISIPSYAEWFEDARPMMGTQVSVRFWHEDAVLGEQLVHQVFAEAERIDRLMSTYIEDSRISEINRLGAQEPVAAGDELFQIIRRSLDISVLTLGAFDITYESVGQHYDFRNRQRPDEATVAAERELIDFRFVELDQVKGTVYFLQDGVRINLGGIAKGYVVERGVDILRLSGVQHAIVTAGGDSRLLDYERYFVEGEVRYHHIIQPSTGVPASGVHSATVFGPDAVITDALSTSVFVMGVDQGLRLIATLPDYESIVIDDAGRIYYSDGLQPPGAQNPD
jgi:thiamine biosynthesis lipoprotein